MIEVRIDDAEVATALFRLRAKLGNLRPEMRAVGELIRADIGERFSEQRGPDGAPWKPLTMAAIVSRARRHASAGYAKRRAKTLARFASGAKALLDTGALRNSIAVSGVTDAEVTVGTNLAYAAIHHFGGKAGRGKKVTIPARPFMGVSTRGRSMILDHLRDRLESAAQP